MAKTVRVRIAVATLPDGSWDAYGYGLPNSVAISDEELAVMAIDNLEGRPLVSFIEADVPVPEEAATIEGKVES